MDVHFVSSGFPQRLVVLVIRDTLHLDVFMTLIWGATDLLTCSPLSSRNVDTMHLCKHKTSTSISADAKHLKHLARYTVGNGVQLQTQLGPLGLMAASRKKWAQWRAMKQGGQGVCVYFEAEGLSALTGSWSHMQVVDSVARQIKKSRPRVDLPLKWEWGLDIRQKTWASSQPQNSSIFMAGTGSSDGQAGRMDSVSAFWGGLVQTLDTD